MISPIIKRFFSFVLLGSCFLCLSCKAQSKNSTATGDAEPDNVFTLRPDSLKQVVWGIGFEIQSDAIGSGNNGLPDTEHSVPHDLTISERERFAKEMLAGFRYCRLAGGLYWRGTDPEGKYLQPRWPEQLEELKEMMEMAGIEGVSLEYWSAAPYWKANETYIGKGSKDKYNTLKCFGPDFHKDPVYKGDTVRFLQDYAEACVKDIQTLKEAGIKTSHWGISNEPWTSNASYSSLKYFSAKDYVTAYLAAATEIRKYDPDILLMSDTEHGFPRKIAAGMHRPEVAAVVDAYVVHTIGANSNDVRNVHKKIRERLPHRPWFQNEYEYLKGGATPRRCLNTAQHIMNSFQLGENPTWYWLHALKPFKNSEASGYSLGFWKFRDDTVKKALPGYERWVGGPVIKEIPEEFEGYEFVNVTRKSKVKPGLRFSFVINQSATIYILVDQVGGFVPGKDWEETDIQINREGGTDKVYKRKFPKAGTFAIGQHKGEKNGTYGAPHALFIGAEEDGLDVNVGINSPIRIKSKADKLDIEASKMEPGHWIYNDYNWNAVGSFAKHMPWDCQVIDVKEKEYNGDARVLAYKKPDGKHVFVVSNRTGKDYTFKVDTGLGKKKWKGYRYTPYSRGDNTMGDPITTLKGEELTLTLSDLSWEFWEEQ